MGITDSAAQGLMTRLENVGVPRVIGHVIGQCAYVSERRRQPDIPPTVVGRSEVTWLVDQYEKQLSEVDDPIAQAALVQGLCVRVFGSNAEEIFLAGYPEFATPEPAAPNSDEPKTDVLQEQARDELLCAAARYFNARFDSNAPAVAQVVCTLEQKGGAVDGILVVLHDTVCFFDSQDLTVDDVKDGSPILVGIEDITSCRLVKADETPLDDYATLDIQRWFEKAVLLEVRTEQVLVKFRIDLDYLSPYVRLNVERDLRKTLYVIDREIQHHNYKKPFSF